MLVYIAMISGFTTFMYMYMYSLYIYIYIKGHKKVAEECGAQKPYIKELQEEFL